MRFKHLDLNLLAALDALFRHRNVSRAAEELCISQSATSNALSRLRVYFNDPLLIQIGRRMDLSPLGRNLAPQVRDILVQIETATSTARAFDPAKAAQRITMIVSDYSLHTIIPPFLAAMSRAAPGLTFDLRAQQTLPHLLLERGEADLLLAPLPFCSPEHPTEHLFTDDFCCVVDAARAPLTRAEFETAGHIVMQPPNGGESYAVRLCREAGLKVREEVRTFSFASMPALVRGTTRIAMVQRRLAQSLSLTDLRILDMPIPLPPLQQAVQWREHRDRDPLLRWIRSELAACA
jgi:LysR family nod box-dependent transcriptional activator